MTENGFFRTKFFGGFHKQDVLDYYKHLENEGISNQKDLQDKCVSLKKTCDKKDAQAGELSAALVELKNYCESLKKENEEISVLNEQILGLKAQLDSNSKLQEQEEGYKTRCEALSRTVVKAQSEVLQLKGELQREKAKNLTLSKALSEIPVLDLNLNVDSANALGKIATILEAYDEVSRKIVSAKSKADL